MNAWIRLFADNDASGLEEFTQQLTAEGISWYRSMDSNNYGHNRHRLWNYSDPWVCIHYGDLNTLSNVTYSLNMRLEYPNTMKAFVEL